jgi:hypothetical protein
MDWGQFWTLMLQLWIAAGSAITIGFVGSAIIAGVRKGMRGDK